MPLYSPLATIHSVLQTVCASAETNAPLLRKNEAATRAALIDPVLRALGWDTANVQMVEPERTISNTWRADYALHNTHGNITLLIEAKCLGADLEKYTVVQQLLGYAFGFGTPQVLITDGINWHFYQEFKPGSTQTAASFSLQKDDLVGCAIQLLQWLDAAQSGHGILSVNHSASKGAEAIPVTVLLPQKKAVAKMNKSIESASAQFVELALVDKLQLEPNQKPKQLRLPDGVVQSIQT